jgi:hypothetical protein
MLDARADGPRGILPLHDSRLTIEARLLYAALVDRVTITDKRVEVEHLLGCGTAEALAVVHELVSHGWLALRWEDADYALAMVVSWAHEDLYPEVYDELEDEA